MGTLDDAIREHLELKRRLGASDDEIQEKESQAFGKGSRPAPPEPEPEAESPPGPEPSLEPAGEGEPFAAHDVEDAEPTPNGHAPESGWDAAEFGAPPERTRTADEIFEPDEVPSEESLDPELRVRDERPQRGPETAEHAEAWAEPKPQVDEDVLEETPEFLEETPEQDRLWFEQCPPKDFDFD